MCGMELYWSSLVMRHVQIDITVSGINELYFTLYVNLRDVFQVFPSPCISFPSGSSGKQGQSTNQSQTCHKPVFLYKRDRLKRAVWGRLVGSVLIHQIFVFINHLGILWDKRKQVRLKNLNWKAAHDTSAKLSENRMESRALRGREHRLLCM